MPTRPVVALVGDACFTMNGMELLTAVEHQVPVVWIVENNNMHGIIWHGSQLVGGRQAMRCARYRRPLEVASLARAMGVQAWVVDAPDQMQTILAEALAADAPAVIEVRVDPDIAPPIGARARSIADIDKD